MGTKYLQDRAHTTITSSLNIVENITLLREGISPVTTCPRKMAELPVDTSFLTKHLDFSCVSCGYKVDVLSCLPCLHSVSICEKKECRQNLLDRKASCSHCKETFSFPAEGFPRYTFAERKAIAKRREEEGTFCYAEHESPQLAVVFCSDCPGPLCEECHKGHGMVAFLKKHKIKSLDALKDGIASSTNLPLCPAHNKELECFCQDCEVLICTVCPVVGPHKSHRVLFVDKEVGEMNKQPLVQCIKAAKKRMDKMSCAVRDIDDRLFTLHEEGNRCKEDIAEMKDCIIEAVTNRCAILVSEVEEAEEKRRRHLEKHKKTLQDQMKQLEHFKTSGENIVHDGTIREQLSVRKAMIQRASMLTSTPIPSPPPSSSSIHFVSEKREEAEKILSQVGRLSLGADPETSTMEGQTIANNTVECRRWANVPLMLKVVTRDHSGSQCAFGGENVVSVLTPTTCGVPVLGKVEDNRDGTYQVIFVSVPSEECELFVTVNGVHMKGSPVNVKMCYPHTIKQVMRDRRMRRFRALVYTKQGTLLATDKDNKEVCTFAKNGKMLNSFKVEYPELNLDGIASLNDDNIAVSLYSRNCIAVYRPNGELVKEFGSDRLDRPSGLAVNNEGQLFVAEFRGHRVSVYSENGEFQYSFGSRGSQPGEFNYPDQICIGQDGLVYVSDRGNNRVQVFQQDGCFVRQFGNNVSNTPTGLTLTKDGHIIVALGKDNKLSIFSPSGECVHEVKDVGLMNPYGVAVSDDGFIFVADSGNDRIVKL